MCCKLHGSNEVAIKRISPLKWGSIKYNIKVILRQKNVQDRGYFKLVKAQATQIVFIFLESNICWLKNKYNAWISNRIVFREQYSHFQKC